MSFLSLSVTDLKIFDIMPLDLGYINRFYRYKRTLIQDFLMVRLIETLAGLRVANSLTINTKRLVNE
jgi:hypothetical protein